MKFETDQTYEILKHLTNWSYDKQQNRYVDVSEMLRQAMALNPALRVFVASGYYDLATPYFAARYTFEHMGLPETARERLSYGYYASGHMMYLHQDSLAALMKDIHNFIKDCLAG